MPINAIRAFVQLEASGGILLMIATAVALIWANLPWAADLYHALLDLPVEVRLGPLELKKNVLLSINDGLMALFFLLVGLEIKREMLEGELSSPSQVALPGFAALGGVAVPAGIYAAMNWSDPVGSRGWAIPAATDIAFSLAMLSLLGRRVPTALKVFLATLAVLDDLAAIIIIAIFYTEKLAPAGLICAATGVAALVALNRLRVRSLGAYLLVGWLIWVSVLKSGVHATLAGVVLAMAIPLRVTDERGEPLLRRLEHMLHPWVAYLILPLFALANAGVSFAGLSMSTLTGAVTLGIAAGLVLGKPVGVLAATALIVGVGAARPPAGATWRSMFGLALLTGIGFTMSLFIGTLAFEGHGPTYAVATRLGVLGGSLITSLLGLLVLHLTLPPASAKLGEAN